MGLDPKALAIVGSNSQHQHLETRAGKEIRQAGAGKDVRHQNKWDS